MNRKWKTLVLLAGVVLVAAACDNVVSTPAAPSSWSFTGDGFTNGSGMYVNGPGTPPAGRGSALLTIDSTGREAIQSGSYTGLGLSAIDKLSYSTYQVAPGATGGAANLEFDVDYDASDHSTAYQGRLVYVPEMSGTPVVPGTWQTWDTLSGNGAWYSSASDGSGFRPIVADATQASPPCTQATFCTWTTVLGDYPHVRIRPTVSGFPGELLIKVGGNGDPGSDAVDNLTVGVGGQTQLTDFEPGDGHVVVNTTTAPGLGFGFVQDSGSGSGAFVSGPSGADGSGSAQLTLNASADGEAIAGNAYAGTAFNNLTFLSYKTYQKAAGLNAATLQFDGDFDSTDTTTSFQGRVTFEPRVSGGAPVQSGIWQTWNPMTTPSGWWQSHSTVIVGNTSVPAVCTQGAPCSFQQLLTAYPNLAIRGITGQSNGAPIGGGIWLKAGSGWATPFVGNVDSLTIGVKSGAVNGTATYDFEG